MANGAEELFDADQGGTQNLPIAGYVVTQAWAKRYPRTAAAFRRAIEQAQAISDANRTAVEQAIVGFTGAPRLAATLVAADSYPLRVDPVWIRVCQVADLMQRFGLLEGPFNITSMISGG